MWIASALALLLAICAPALAADPGPGPGLEELRLRRQEESLLHRQVDLSTLQRWRPEAQRWQPQAPAPAPLLLVHVWAVECAPCVEEMPQVAKLLRAQLGPVRPILISETLSDRALRDFLRAQAAALGDLEHYRAVDNRLRAALQNEMQPLTLLLDDRFVVRQAFIGVLTRRRSDLVEAIRRFLAQDRGQPADRVRGQLPRTNRPR